MYSNQRKNNPMMIKSDSPAGTFWCIAFTIMFIVGLVICAAS